MIYLQLFLSFFQIGLFSIGGGYAAMPLIKEQVVNLNGWLTMTQFTDVVTIAEMTPGPIAINAATFVGIQIAGIPGALVATFGCVLPSSIIALTLAYLYHRFRGLKVIDGVLSGLRPVVVALIASAGVAILITALFGEAGFVLDLSAVNWVSLLLFGVALVILRIWRPGPIAVMVGCGVVGGIVYTLFPALLK